MRPVLKAVATIAFMLNTSHGFAQSSCLSSVDVDPAKSILYFGWLPDSADAGVSSMYCPAAEALKAELYVNYLSNANSAVFSSPDKLSSELKKAHDKLLAERNKLAAALNDQKSTFASLKIIAHVANYEAAKFFTLYGCSTPSPDYVTKGACVYGLVMIPIETYNLTKINNDRNAISTSLAILDDQLKSIGSAYETRIAEIGKENVSESQKKIEDAFTGLCVAIEKYCKK